MFDLMPFIADFLAETGAQNEIAENDFSFAFPLITLLEVSNISVIIADGKEKVSEISIQLDLYETTPEKVKSLSGVISSLMIAHGFRRGSCQLMKEDGMWREMQQYSCYVDEQGRIYCGENYI